MPEAGLPPAGTPGAERVRGWGTAQAGTEELQGHGVGARLVKREGVRGEERPCVYPIPSRIFAAEGRLTLRDQPR